MVATLTATHDSVGLLIVALLVGMVVGITGMGGGALMTPALILLGIPPANAIANDLVAAAVTKSVASAVHWRTGQASMRVAGLLVVGSVPSAVVASWLAWHTPALRESQEPLRWGIGAALLLAAAVYILRALLPASKMAATTSTASRVPATLLVGALGGVLVALTSVGAGSIMMVALLLLYPTMSSQRLVATDLIQSVPLVTAAALTHLAAGGTSLEVLAPLLVGGPVGSYTGARLAPRVNARGLRLALVSILGLTGATMLRLPLPYAAAVAGLMAVTAYGLRDADQNASDQP